MCKINNNDILPIEAMLSLSQSSGKVPFYNDWLNITVSTGASSVVVSQIM